MALMAIGCSKIKAGQQPSNQSSNQPAAEASADAGFQAPGQPASGPGGMDYAHNQIKMSRGGEGAEAFVLFEPADPVPDSAPVVAFLHGWGAMNPSPYRAWIDHLVKKGAVVIFPKYQGALRFPPEKMTPAAATAIKNALAMLKEEGHVAADEGKFYLVGHSLGGVIAANLAAGWENEGLPKPLAAMVVEPGDANNGLMGREKRLLPSILGDCGAISADIKLLAVVGSDDRLVGQNSAKKIVRDAAAVPRENKALLVVNSDAREGIELKANHFFPAAPGGEGGPEGPGGRRKTGPVREKIRERLQERAGEAGGGDESADEEKAGEEKDAEEMAEMREGRKRNAAETNALDYYGTWRLFDALIDCSTTGKHCDLCLQDGEPLRSMGKWSDGTPVKELTYVQNLEDDDAPEGQ